MKVIDPGHRYELDRLDDHTGGLVKEELVFVKREGPKYPGNVGSHTGTTIQEVLRALLERCRYVNDQEFSVETWEAAKNIEDSIVLLEKRAAHRHGRHESFSKIPVDDVIWGVNKCELCGHVGCPGDCRHK